MSSVYKLLHLCVFMCMCRYLVNPNQTLEIHYVTVQDAGRYTCTAANDVGVVTASAQLLVEGKVLSCSPSKKHLENQRLQIQMLGLGLTLASCRISAAHHFIVSFVMC